MLYKYQKSTYFNGMDRKTFLKRSVGLGISSSILGGTLSSLHAYSAHSQLKNPELIERFREISNGLVCVCGKNLPISQINDIGHCNTWPMRSVIDGLLSDNYSPEFILDGFANGFKGLVDSHPAFAMSRGAEYGYMLDGLRSGFGEKILSEPTHGGSLLSAVAGVGTMLIAGLVAFISRNRKPIGESNEQLSDDEADEMVKKIKD